MIRTTFNRDADGRLIGYSAKGHSGYAEAGSDIVCAAVSVLGATCINSLEAVCGVVSDIVENDEGILVFRLPQQMTDMQWHDAQVLMGALEQGLKDLAEQFPQNLRIAYKTGGKCND